MGQYVSQFMAITFAMRDWISLLGQSQDDWESFASSRHGEGVNYLALKVRLVKTSQVDQGKR